MRHKAHSPLIFMRNYKNDKNSAGLGGGDMLCRNRILV